MSIPYAGTIMLESSLAASPEDSKLPDTRSWIDFVRVKNISSSHTKQSRKARWLRSPQPSEFDVS